jgi:hypothetical protein
MMVVRLGRLLLLFWILFGIWVAWSRSYIGVALIRAAGSALLAIFLWPLVLLGVNLHIH